VDVFTAASHQDVLALVIQIAVLLFTARALGEVARRLGQPAVVGEILAGILLGPSFLSSLIPAVGAWIVPQTPVRGYLLETISMVGVMFLLLITGLETDIPLIRRHARTALSAATGGLLLPLLTGFLLGLYLPETLLAAPDERLVFALFVAAALSISAIPVIAKVLIDLNLMRRDIGQTIIAAGMVDDTTAWILLSVIIGLAGGGQVTALGVAESVGSVVAFLLISFTVGRWLARRALRFVQDKVTGSDAVLTLIVVLAFGWGAVTQAIGLEALFGAFVMGILFGQLPRLHESVVHTLERMTLAILAPIFFAVAGLKVNLIRLAEPATLAIALLVIFVAVFGKVVGTYTGARILARKDHWTALGYGAALNARGAMEIIIATIGLNAGILSQTMFSIIVVMAITTSLMSPAALRWVLTHIEPEQQELDRLRREEMAVGSVVAGIHRVLLPLRRQEEPFGSQMVEARLLERSGAHGKLSVTLMHVMENGVKRDAEAFLKGVAAQFRVREVERKVVDHADQATAILDEVHKGYGLLVLGASERHRDGSTLFTPLVDTIVRFSPVPTLVVQGPPELTVWAPGRIMVPAVGTPASRHAAELAFAIARPGTRCVLVMNVVQPVSSRRHDGRYEYREAASAGYQLRQYEEGRQMVKKLAELGRLYDVEAETTVVEGESPEDTILEVAEANAIDLIILGTSLRPWSSRLYLGPRVEYILSDARCPVVVLNTN